MRQTLSLFIFAKALLLVGVMPVRVEATQRSVDGLGDKFIISGRERHVGRADDLRFAAVRKELSDKLMDVLVTGEGPTVGG